jgi:hypothetical protein
MLDAGNGLDLMIGDPCAVATQRLDVGAHALGPPAARLVIAHAGARKKPIIVDLAALEGPLKCVR